MQKAINIRQEETLVASSRDLPMQEEGDASGEVIPSEGGGDSPGCQSFEETLFGWSQVLEDSSKLTPLTEELRHHLTFSVMYSYLFLPFHLMFNHITFQIFI